MIRKSTIWPVLLAVCLFAGALNVQATNYYVATTGVDNNPAYGKHVDSPAAKISYLIHETSNYPFNPGDTIFVEPGVYNDYINTGSYIGSRYDRLKDVTIIGTDENDKPILRPIASSQHIVHITDTTSELKVIGFVLDGSLNTVNKVGVDITGDSTNDNSIINCEIMNCAGAVHTSGKSKNNEIKNCHIHHNDNTTAPGFGTHAMYIVGPGTIVDGNNVHHQYKGNGIRTGTDDCLREGNNIVIRNNTISYIHYPGNIDRGGVYVSATTHGVQVYNNVIYNCANGVIVGAWADSAQVFHNTIYNNLGFGLKITDLDICPGGTKACVNTQVKNNLFYKNGDPLTGFNGFYIGALSEPTLDSSNNIWNIYDPEFIDRGAANFYLTSGSDAIGAAPRLTSVLKDKDGANRSNPATIGAYEGGSGSYTDRSIFYVSTSGDDMDAGTSGAPYQSIIRSMQELFPGDTLVVMGNDSFFFDYENLVPYGEPDDEIVIVGNTGDKPVFRRATPNIFGSRPVILGMDTDFRYNTNNDKPHDVIIDGIVFDAKDYTAMDKGTCFSIGEQRNTFKNCIFQNFNRYNIIDASGKHTQIINSIFETVTVLSGSSPLSTDSCTIYIAADSCLFLRDTLKGNTTGHGIYLHGAYSYFDSCEIKSSRKHGIYIDGSVNTNQGHHNTFINGRIRSNGYPNGGYVGISCRGSYNQLINSEVSTSYYGIKIYSTNYQNFPADHNVVRDCNITGNTFHGIILDYSRNDTISANSIRFNDGYGIYLTNTAYTSIERNNINSNALDGIRSDAGSYGPYDTRIFNNIIDYNENCGIRMTGSLTKIYNNTVANNEDTGIYVHHEPSPSLLQSVNIYVKNNLVYSNDADSGPTDIFFAAGAGGSDVTNWETTDGPSGVYSIPAHSDYHPLTGSSLIDTGTTLTEVVDDFEGNARPYNSVYDIGAYEYGYYRPAGNDDDNGLSVINTDILADDIRIYPVPFGDELMIEAGTDNAKDNLHYELYNQLGSLVAWGNIGHGKATIRSEESWSNGLYLLRVLSADGVKTYKVQLQR